MRKIFTLLILILLVFSCKKEKDYFLWERSYGTGKAFFVRSTPESEIISCGVKNGNPFLIRLSKEKNIEAEYTSDRTGLFSSVWSDTSCFIAGGSSNGKMLLSRIDLEGNKIWDTTFTAGFYIDLTNIIYTGSGNFLAVGSASPDSSNNGATGLLLVRFDTTSQIVENKEITETTFLSVSDVATDNAGNFYFAITKKTTGAKTKASVAKYNNDLQKLWETELYNNPDFGAACLGIVTDNEGNLYVSGKTEVTKTEGTLDNSFMASLSTSGSVNWKKYLENSNSGSSIIINDSGILTMLNKNCFIINLAESVHGEDAGRIRMFSVCNPYNTDAFGADLDICPNSNIVLAGSLGENFYLALKSSP